LLALVGGVELAASFVLNGWSALLAAVLCVAFSVLWFLVPLRHRDRHRNHT